MLQFHIQLCSVWCVSRCVFSRCRCTLVCEVEITVWPCVSFSSSFFRQGGYNSIKAAVRRGSLEEAAPSCSTRHLLKVAWRLLVCFHVLSSQERCFSWDVWFRLLAAFSSQLQNWHPSMPVLLHLVCPRPPCCYSSEEWGKEHVLIVLLLNKEWKLKPICDLGVFSGRNNYSEEESQCMSLD